MSNNCESKIRTACQQFPSREWSGAAFYKITYLNGKDKDSASLSDIRIDVLDFCLQDIGSAAYTEYDLDENTASYLADHIDTLLGAKIALLHSHNSMKAFFSGTDLNTLHEQASQCNNVLSIVVNNDGNYVAKFTQKETVHQVDNITVDSTIDTHFSLFGESNRSYHNTQSDYKSNTLDKYQIRIYDCDILRPLNMPIDEEFKQECIDKERELNAKRMKNKYPVEDVVFQNTDRHPFSGWLFDHYTDAKDKHNPDTQHDIDLLARSILFLSLDIKALKAPRHIFDVPLYHVSEEVVSSFLEAWFCYFFPDVNGFSDVFYENSPILDEINQIVKILGRYFAFAGNMSSEIKNIQELTLEIINNYGLYFMN